MAAAPQFALVDVNNFYVSCERVFKPCLENTPLLSSRTTTAVPWLAVMRLRHLA